MRSARRQRLPGKADAAPCVRACVCECRRPSACGCYLYRPLHANGSCETSQTFFPTVTSHQSGRGTRGPEGGRTDGSWSAPSHWSPPPCSRWRPMAHSREGGWRGEEAGVGSGGSDYLQPFNHHTVLQTPTDRREQAEDTGDGNSGSLQRTGSFGSAH